MGLIGVVVIFGLALAISTDRKRALVPRLFAWGLGLQVATAVVALKTSWGVRLMRAANDAAAGVIGFTDAGIQFMFGNWPGITVVHTPSADGAGSLPVTVGFLFAIKVLPLVIFMASLMAVLYHLGVMQLVVRGLARAFSRAMRISGAEALSTVGDVFLGMTEAPLLIRPYVARMTNSELFAVMTAGMATIAGSVFLAYVAMGIDAGYLVTASFMSAPAAVLIAKIIVPETGVPQTMGGAKVDVPKIDVNVVDAAARGASEGLQLALNVGAMLIAFVALVHMVDAAVGWVGGLVGWPGLRMADVVGAPLAPLAFVMGVPWSDAPAVGALLGIKTMLNEFLAYQELARLAPTLDPRTVRIASFALCGFANFGSLAIVLGGLGGMVPERRPDLARLGLRAVVAGALATCLTGTVAGLVSDLPF